VHGVLGEPGADPPGLTPLTGQYRRPDEAWACYELIGDAPPFIASQDVSKGSVRCVRVKDLEVSAKLTYYAAKTLQVLESLPPPG